ncbi:type I restriction-modification system subunit M [Flavicella sp.]|uniref:type I restriction-modification system subunit M n=1 Tax=Flavicella sp. TaxID=2957742 RepID=UPI00301835D0
MTAKQKQEELGKVLWDIANDLRGAMNADDFRDYMLSFLFLRYLSDNYEGSVKKELGSDYPILAKEDKRTPLSVWYEDNEEDIEPFEKQMRKKVHYVIKPEYLWASISELARTQHNDLLSDLQDGFKYIENESFESSFKGLFSEINLDSEKLGKTYTDRNKTLCKIIKSISDGISEFSTDSDTLGDAYEYLIGEFAAGSGKKAGEFYTPQQLSTILSEIVTLDSQNPKAGKKKKLNRVLDFACGSGSLLLNVKSKIENQEGGGTISRIYGQEKNITTYNLARMNMLLHGVKDSEFEIFHGDTLKNEWDILNEMNPAKKYTFDAIVANPPFSLRWDASEAMGENFRYKNYGLAPKSAADFAFLLHGFHFLSDEGTMAIILPHGVLFRGGAESRIRTKLLKDGNIDTVIGLPSNLFFSTGIPVCILILKKCKKDDDVLFINASEHYKKEKRQNILREGKDGEANDIQKIVETYQNRPEKIERYARRVSMEEIEKNDYNLNISRYVSTAIAEVKIDLKEVNEKLADIEKKANKSLKEHNKFLTELGLETI